MYSCNSCQTSWSMDVDPPQICPTAPGFWFPEWCFWFPWCVFFPEWCFQFPEVRWFPGCFQFPGWGVFSSQIRVCCSRNGVLGARGCFLFPEWLFRSRPEGTAWRCLWFPYGVSSYFFLLLCFSLFVASFLFSFLSSFLPLLPCFLLFHKTVTVRGSQFFLKMCPPLCDWWCPPLLSCLCLVSLHLSSLHVSP